MWNGKKKAVTFSFDDGVTQDIRLVEILNKYGLKCTFNLNSALLGMTGELTRNGRLVRHDKVKVSEVKELYAGHELAVHTLTHPDLRRLDDEAIAWQVEADRMLLESICGYPVVGMAYPGGSFDDRVVEALRTKTKIRYARGVETTYGFDLQTDLLRFQGSVYYIDERFEEVVDNFLALETKERKLLYIWGHSYEMDAEYISWEKFERICKKLSGKEDIFYGTNSEVLL